MFSLQKLKSLNVTLDNLFLIGFLAFLYFISGKLSFYLSLSNSIVTISIFFPEGVALAAVILFGKKIIPGIFVGQVFLALSTGLPLDLSLLIGMTNALEGVLAYKLLKKFQFDSKIMRIRDLYLLFLLIICILQPFSALSGTWLLWLYGFLDDSVYKTLFSWWFGNSMGQMLLTPALLFLYHYRDKVSFLFSLFLFILFALLNYFFIQVLYIDNIALLFSLMIPLMMFVSAYFGLHYAAITVFSITVSSLVLFRMGLGIFSQDTVLNNLININFYILAHLLIVYIHGVLIIEKERMSEELSVLNKNLLKEIHKEVEDNRIKDRMMMHQSRQAQIGEMIAMVAHQWKQPLNALSLTQQRFYHGLIQGALDEQSIKRFHQKSQNYIQHMSETIENFRLFFKPEDNPGVFDLINVVEHVKNIVSPILEEERIELLIDIPEELWITGYRNGFGQVLLNLIINAKDAFKSKIEQDGKYIKIATEKIDGGLYIKVEDNAGGVPPQYIDKIFDAYFSTKDVYNGTGLGLYIAKIIIEKHMSGQLFVENIEKGALFNIFISSNNIEDIL